VHPAGTLLLDGRLWSLVFFNGKIEGERKCVVHTISMNPDKVYIIDVINQSKISQVEIPINY